MFDFVLWGNVKVQLDVIRNYLQLLFYRTRRKETIQNITLCIIVSNTWVAIGRTLSTWVLLIWLCFPFSNRNNVTAYVHPTVSPAQRTQSKYFLFVATREPMIHITYSSATMKHTIFRLAMFSSLSLEEHIQNWYKSSVIFVTN